MTFSPASTSISARVALGALWLYKRTLSPVFYYFGARCRHAPACSEYAADAFARHGAWGGFWLSFSRVCRCHPFGSHGFDPVPETLPRAGWRFWRLGDWAWTERGAQSTFSNVSEKPPGLPSAKSAISARSTPSEGDR